MNLFNGLICINTNGTQTEVINKLLIEEDKSTDPTVDFAWNFAMQALNNTLSKLLSKQTAQPALEHQALKEVNKAYEQLKEAPGSHAHEMHWKHFLLNAQSGFNFGSNCHGTLDTETGEVTFDSHGEEFFEYKSLRDFYDHYVLEKPTAYRYAILIGTHDEESGHIEWHCGHHEEKLKGQTIDYDGSDILSDWIDMPATSGYSSREDYKLTD